MIETTQSTTTPTVTGLKGRTRPGLKLNLGIPKEADAVVINRCSTSTFVIENHPRYTDQNEYSYSTVKKYESIFFAGNAQTDNAGDQSYSGDSYHVVYKANGKEQQDRFKIRTPTLLKNLNFFGVYDGHSTHLIAELLANKMDEYILENLKYTSDLVGAAKQAFMALETEVMNGLKEHKPRGGSTALCSMIYNQKIYTANLGDARAIMFRENDFIPLSNIHDFKNQSECDYVHARGGTVINNRLQGELAVSRSIGDINYKAYMNPEPDVMVTDIRSEDDYLIIATDGFWNGLSPEQCLTKINQFKASKGEKDLSSMSEFLVEAAKANILKKKDNMTCIVVDLKQLQAKSKPGSSQTFF